MRSRLVTTALLLSLSGGAYAAGGSGGDIGGAAGGAVGGTSGAGMGTTTNGAAATSGVGTGRGGGIGGSNDGTMRSAPGTGGMQPPGATRNMSSGVTSPQNTPSPSGGGSRGGW